MADDAKAPKMVGRYRIYGEIAAGGMATVHIGRLIGPAAFSRTVAIKRLHAQFAKDPEFVAMLLDEARLAARIVHPNVVSTLDIVAEEGELFLVMDYVAGESLAQLLKKAAAAKRPPPVGVAVSLGVDLLLGLHAAHEAKSQTGPPLEIVHRDVSPQNLLVGEDGVGRVVDFGVAKAVFRSSSTRDGKIKGKLSYMSPEQMQAGNVDRRSDVFAAGVVIWETLTGQRLFSRPDPGGTIAAVLADAVEPPSSVVSDIPPALDAVVLKALEKKAEDRFATAGEMAKALAEAFQPAGAMSVSEWVREVAKDTLAARARRVAEVESHSATGAELTEADPGEVTQHANATDHTASVVGVPKTSSRPMVWGLAGAVVVLLGIVWFMAARSTAQPIAAPVTAASPAPPVVRSAPPVAAATPSAVPTASAAPAASEQEAVPSPPARKVVRRPALEKAAPAKTAKPTKAAKPGCDPPYTVDGQGEKVFKPECF